MAAIEHDRIGAANGQAVPSAPPSARRSNINAPLNIGLISVAIGGTLLQLFAMPFVLHAVGWPAIWLLVPIMLLQPMHWGLLHEAIHSHLLPNARAERVIAHVLAVLLGAPLEATRFSHLLHHRFSRHGYDRADMFDGEGSYLLAWIRYWGRLFGGAYLGMVASPLFSLVPRSVGVRVMHRIIPIREDGDLQLRRLFTSLVVNVPKRRQMRREFCVVLLVYGASAWFYGPWWPVLLASVYVRGLWHSFADNVGHHAVEFDEPKRARDYTLPALWRFVVLNQNLHLSHHLHPNTPWTLLAGTRGSGGDVRHGSYFRAALRQVDRSYPRRPARPDAAA